MPYGTIACDTLTASTGVLATQNGMTGIAKAWAQFNGTSGAVNGSFNVSSVTRNSTGNYTINFTTAMPNGNYAVSGISRNGNIAGLDSGTAPTTTSFLLYTSNISGTSVDGLFTAIAVFSS